MYQPASLPGFDWSTVDAPSQAPIIYAVRAGVLELNASRRADAGKVRNGNRAPNAVARRK
jgi:hypothetical protein